MSSTLSGISSMATRALLNELATMYLDTSGVRWQFEAAGGVDVARRVAAGEAFDVVVLAEDALARLAASGHVLATSVTPLVRSPVALAMRAGAARPDIGSEAALRRALLAARSVGYSTGPSGTALLQLIERWGLAALLRERLVQAPPGVPVGRLVAQGEVELGLQQLSELMHLPGIELVGALPEGAQIITTFAAAQASASTQGEAVRALLAFLTSPPAAAAAPRHGMQAA